ncbi:uncharacterized protein [Clinocottus analis]|uniref:uncharacterized protein isoform X1 n=1 Tax=Clinocottus analis TaxID=304258 RepID=UPI0035BF4D2B
MSVGPMPLERFVTTYSCDYKRREPRCEAAAAPASIIPPKTHCETWPVFHQYFYKTTNSNYGSTSCPQPPSCSRFPGCLHPLGIPAPVFEPTAFVGTLPEAKTQEVGKARETGPLLGKKKGQLHYVFGEKAKVLEQLEAKDESQKNLDVLYEEGVIVWSSHDGPACWEDLLKSVCREAGLHNLPVASSPVITTKDDENWDASAYLRSLKLAVGLKNSTFVQPTPKQCSCCAGKTEWRLCCCCRMKTFPPCILHSRTRPLAHAKPTYCTEPRRSSPLTEYQAGYTAEWA